MANEPSSIPGKSAEKPQPQNVPLAKIHDLPGTFISKPPDRSYGGLVSSIQSIGVTEPVILRQREDGEYQLLAGYRRRRASELAKKQDIPALVYEMTMQEALAYHQKQKSQPDVHVPGKLLPAPAPDVPKQAAAKSADSKKPEAPASTPSAASKQAEAKGADGKKPEAPASAPPTAPKPGEVKGADGKNPEAPASTPPTAPKQAEAKGADGKKPEAPASAPSAVPKQAEVKGADGKKPEAPASTPPTAPKQTEDKGVDGKKPEAPASTPSAAPKQTEAKGADGKKPEAPISAPSATPKQAEAKGADGKKPEAPASTPSAVPKQAEDKGADGKKPEVPASVPPAAPKQVEAKGADDKKPEAPASAPPTAPKPGEAKAADDKKVEAPVSAPPTTPKEKGQPATKKVVDFPKPAKAAAAPAGPAAAGPTGTAITQLFDARLDPPDEQALKALPIPKEGDSYFISLHPAYLTKSKFNTFSVDRASDNFKELYKAIELSGIKDPVLARPKADGGLEILSGQRRHLIGTELNYPIPTIIQQIDDDDAKIMVADSNLHRDKISTYDLSRALRMKADGMKRKAGRRRKNDPSVPLLNTNEALAREMGMPVSKLDRIIRLSEATKEVCDRYDENRLDLSIAHSISFLKPKNQDMVMHLSDLGYKLSTVRVERMKKVEKAGKLTEAAMRDILEDKDLAPKKPPVLSGNATPATPTAPATPASPPTPATPSSGPALVSAALDPPATPTEAPPAGPSGGDTPKGQDLNPPVGESDIFKGAQERPENVKVILTGDRLRRYYPDVTMTPREIEEDIYDKLDRCRKMDERQAAKEQIFKKSAPSR